MFVFSKTIVTKQLYQEVKMGLISPTWVVCHIYPSPGCFAINNQSLLKDGVWHKFVNPAILETSLQYLLIQLNARIILTQIWSKSIQQLLRYCHFHVLCYFCCACLRHGAIYGSGFLSVCLSVNVCDNPSVDLTVQIRNSITPLATSIKLGTSIKHHQTM